MEKSTKLSIPNSEEKPLYVPLEFWFSRVEPIQATIDLSMPTRVQRNIAKEGERPVFVDDFETLTNIQTSNGSQ